MNRRLLLISVALLIIIIAIVLSSQQSSFKTTLLQSKPTLVGTYIKNSDILHDSAGFLSLSRGVSPEDLLQSASEWNGTAFVGYNIRPLGGRNGIAIIHPVDGRIGRFIEQETYLPPGRFKLLLE